ncbi:MAG: hypothetical protein HY554_18610 [Elusimicrobia bacterium]|nr:hypothetical protein [Elusimicrobiota bacterium]
MRISSSCRAAAAALLSLAAPALGAEKLVASIGERGTITERDLADFSAAEGCYGPDALNSRRAGFMRMLETSVMEEVLLAEAGVRLGEHDYAREAERIDRETQAPDILRCIKAHFSFDPAAGFRSKEGAARYRRVFLRKVLAQTRFQRFVHYDVRVQTEAYRARDRILEGTKQGEGWPALAAKLKVGYSTSTYALEEPKASTAAPPSRPWSPWEAQFIETYLKPLAPGQAKADPIESEENLAFVRLLSVDGSAYRFEMLSVRKKGFRDYLGSLKKLPVRVDDAELRDWVRGIAGNHILAGTDIR